MPSLLRSAFRVPRTQLVRLPGPTPLQRATFTSATHLCIKEDSDLHPEELDKIKREQKDKAEKGEGHWHEELASAGEASVRADREKVHDHDDHMEDLQKQTAEKVEKDHPHGKDSH